MRPIVMLLLFLIASPLLVAQPPGRAAGRGDGGLASGSQNVGKEEPKRLLREGTRLTNVLGKFRMTGDRYAFFPDDPKSQKLTVLENLLLDRITGAADFHSRRVWEVSGHVTQYRGANYLLLTWAVAKGDAGVRSHLRKRLPKQGDARDEKRAGQRP